MKPPLGVAGVRAKRTLSQKGVALLHGLPCVVADLPVPQLLGARSVADAQRLQVARGRLRRASGHSQGTRLVIAPHRRRSDSKRQRRRHRQADASRPTKVAQTCFVLDADTAQPVCCTPGTAARTGSPATPALLALARAMLQPDQSGVLVLADAEPCTQSLLAQVQQPDQSGVLVLADAEPCTQALLAQVHQHTTFDRL